MQGIVARGWSSHQIAAELRLSSTTVTAELGRRSHAQAIGLATGPPSRPG